MTTDNAFAQLSDGMAAAVERASAWTVTVSARRRLAATGVVWAAGGLVVTADHVIEREENIGVTLPDGTKAAASLVGRDPGADLALLRVEGTTAAAELAPEGAARVGHLALALGRPWGAMQASLGVVSAVGGAWRSRTGTQVSGSLWTDTTMLPGFSGGPLVDAQGRVLGINTSRFRGNMTLATSAVSSIVELLQQHGRVRRAYLGIASQAVRLPEGAANQETGLLIVNVEAGTPAAAAGLVVGDVLLGIEGSPTRAAEDLQALLGPERVGVSVRLQLLRGGAPHEVTVTLGERA